MEIITRVPKTIIDQLKSGQTVYAKTNFNHYSKRAYQILSRIAQMPNFFFGFENDVSLYDELLDMVTYSSEQNNYNLKLNLPHDILFRHDYYDFSSLIYWCEGSEGYFDEDIVQDYIKCVQNVDQPGYARHSLKQVIYPRIEPDWVIDYDFKS